MVTRRQFIIGLGAFAASTFLSFNWAENSAGKPPLESQPVQSIDCDWVIENVMIVDGSGEPGFLGNVAIKGEEIVAVGEFTYSANAKKIDGQELVLAPGFIDIHTHTESYVNSGESLAPFLSQGVTTQIGGNCGRSPKNIGNYLANLPPAPMNYGVLMGYRTLRESALGNQQNRKVNPIQLKKMQEDLAKAMQAGALGLSTGLEYWPQTYASFEELIELCQVVKGYGGFYATHVRNEYEQVLIACKEAIEIGFQTEVPVQYCHIKAGHKQNWGKFSSLLAMIQEANSSGLDITADVYPYTFSSMDIGTNPLRYSMCQENVAKAIVHPQVFFASDTGMYQGGRATHPRAYGTYPRILGYIVRGKNILSLEEAVKKMTSQPARRLKLKDRGLIRTGFKADLVLFHPTEVIDTSTAKNPSSYSKGIRHVWVNGQLVYSEGKLTQAKSGQIISYNGIKRKSI